jgi:hypothetical protein
MISLDTRGATKIRAIRRPPLGTCRSFAVLDAAPRAMEFLEDLDFQNARATTTHS